MPQASPTGRVNRNDPCPCGSGKKYKKCCMGTATPGRRAKSQGPQRPAASTPPPAEVLRKAVEAAQAGHLDQAEKLYAHVLQVKPKDVTAAVGLAEIKSHKGRTGEAIELLEQVIAADDSHAAAHCILAHVLVAAGRIEEARRCANRAVKLAPDNEAAHRQIAECHFRMRRFDEALAAIDRALAIQSTPDGEILRATLLRHTGALDEARAYLERIIPQQSDSERVARALKEHGFVLDKLGEYDAAFESFERGGRERAKTAEAKKLGKTIQFEHIEQYGLEISPELVSKWTSESFDDGHPVPVFLVGFPRSGTTMTEQIMGAHPRIITADEKPLLSAVAHLMGRWFTEPSHAAMLKQLDRGDILKLRAAYWQAVEAEVGPLAPDTVFVNKMPLNIVEVGLINVVFPEARVIVALRDPRDCCLSAFMQQFGLNASMINFLWWERTADFYSRVMGLWLRLRDMITLDFIEIRYEDTVSDLEAQARRILEFLRLPWDEAVLSFHEKAKQRFISTPSFTAVSDRAQVESPGQ